VLNAERCSYQLSTDPASDDGKINNAYFAIGVIVIVVCVIIVIVALAAAVRALLVTRRRNTRERLVR